MRIESILGITPTNYDRNFHRSDQNFVNGDSEAEITFLTGTVAPTLRDRGYQVQTTRYLGNEFFLAATPKAVDEAVQMLNHAGFVEATPLLGPKAENPQQ